MIGVIVPFTRPKFAENVLANFGRQTFQDKVLVIVENGRGLGTFNAGTIVRSDPDRSSARNAGIQKVREMGIGYWAIMEDDDWYGPDYLQEVWDARDKADVTGKWCYQIQRPDGELYWRGVGHTNSYPDFIKRPVETELLAATIAGRTDIDIPFRPEISYGEEVMWYMELQMVGHTLYSRGSENFRLIRYSDPDHRHAAVEHGILGCERIST